MQAKTADFQRIQGKVQRALDGESLENSTAVLSAVLVVAVCCGTFDKPAAQRLLDSVYDAMRYHLDQCHDQYARDYKERLHATTH